jgi:intraflagellar transport protein 56
LNSIKSYFYNDDTFNFNYAQALAAVGSFKDANEVKRKFFFLSNI